MIAGRDLDRVVVEAAETVVRTFERERFAPTKPSEADVARAVDAPAHVSELVGRR